MSHADICAVLVTGDPAAAERVADLVELFEVRLDLIGAGWSDLVPHLKKPWIATNRPRREGGRGNDDETGRLESLFKALEAGAAMADIELGTANLARVTRRIKQKGRCIVSYHNFTATPLYPELAAILEAEKRAGADVCKVVTTAQSPADNFRLLQLLRDFPATPAVAFAMGECGTLSRILCPLVGGLFTYASVGPGAESAPGQLTAAELRNLYGMVQKC
jgi:3-dehydroquinate dehydratase I